MKLTKDAKCIGIVSLAVVFLLFVSGLALASQPKINVSGVVKDASNGEALPYAQVEVQGNEA